MMTKKTYLTLQLKENIYAIKPVTCKGTKGQNKHQVTHAPDNWHPNVA
jgi:hypothetical protein